MASGWICDDGVRGGAASNIKALSVTDRSHVGAGQMDQRFRDLSGHAVLADQVLHGAVEQFLSLPKCSQ